MAVPEAEPVLRADIIAQGFQPRACAPAVCPCELVTGRIALGETLIRANLPSQDANDHLFYACMDKWNEEDNTNYDAEKRST